MIDINEEYKDMTFDDVIDDGTAWELDNWNGDIPQVVLFKGPYGCGKNLLAYLFAKKLSNVDINVRNTVDNTAKGAEELINQYSSPPFVPDMHQVCVLNEFTMFRKDAMGKFKDAFQAPPRRTYFFVCTNEPEVIPADVYSRFKLVVSVDRLTPDKAFELVEHLCDTWGITLKKKAKLEIANKTGGVPRTIRNTLQSGTPHKVQESKDDPHKAFMELFWFLQKERRGIVSPKTVKILYEKTQTEADSFRFKMLGMIYNSFLDKHHAYNIYLGLLPPLQKGVEKHDLLVRLVQLTNKQ